MYYSENINNVSVIRRIPSEPYRFQGCLEFEDPVDMDRPAIEQVIAYYSDALLSSSRALEFLDIRGIYDEEAISRFRLGFSDRSLGLKLCELGQEEEGAARGALQRVGLLKPSGHEFLRGSLVFPFLDSDGSAVGAYGRRVTPKLKAYSVYHVHWLTDETVFFNQNVLSCSKSAILCKTPLEALTWWCSGFKHIVALMGSMSFGDRHMQALKLSHVRDLYIAFGSTPAEISAARSIAIQVAKNGIYCRFVMYPLGMDANAFALSVADPADALADLLDHSFVLDKSIGSNAGGGFDENKS